MEKLTQSRKDNCWQTCVAVLLGCPAESLPGQHEYATRDEYGKVLRVFLDKHYDVTYVEVGPDQFEGLPICFKQRHVMIGECTRSTAENGFAWHAVVGELGKIVWDVSPTRAGLTKIQGYGLLVPTPPEHRATWIGSVCECPRCASERKVA